MEHNTSRCALTWTAAALLSAGLAQASETEQTGDKMSDSHSGYYSKVSKRESLVDTLEGLTFFSAEIGLW